MDKEILKTIRYFSFFNYYPTFDEIYIFIKEQTSKRHLASILEKMEKKGAIKSQILISKSKISNYRRYTLGEYSINIKNQNLKIKNSIEKVQKVKNYIKFISFFPQIQLVGLSGTVSMMNAEKKDDIDLFIITAKNRLFTGRFISIVMGYVLGVRRMREEIKTKDKVCLNLFFDEKDLKVPKRKQTEYVAHEVLQMKPLVNKNSVYERFLGANRWVVEIFPNAHQISNFSHFALQATKGKQILNYLGDRTEFLLKYLQLHSINRHRTTEIITSTQLWFFPEDFEKKIKYK